MSLDARFHYVLGSFEVYFPPKDWKRQGFNTRKRIHCRMEQSRNVDCSSKLFALPASTVFPVPLPLQDHHLQCDKLVTPDALFPL